jgi:ParB-like chromosome segregation protein Spo0J
MREMTDAEAIRIAVADNEQREDTNIIEKARSYQMMHDPPYNYTIEYIAALTGKSRWIVSQAMALTQQPKEIQNWIISGELTMSRVQFLSRIPDKAQRVAFAKSALQHEWSVRKLDRYTKPFVASDKPATGEEDASKTAETSVADVAPETREQKSSADVVGRETATSGVPAKTSRKKGSATRSTAQSMPKSAHDVLSKVLQHATEQVAKHAKTTAASASEPQVFPWWALGVLALGMIAFYVGEWVSSPTLSLVLLAINGMLVIVGAGKLLGYVRATHRRWIPALADLVSSPRKVLEWPRILRQRVRNWIPWRRQKHTAAPASQSHEGAPAEASPSPEQAREGAPAEASPSREQAREGAPAEASRSREQVREVPPVQTPASAQSREVAPAENAPTGALVEGHTLEESLRERFGPSPTKDDSQAGPKSS